MFFGHTHCFADFRWLQSCAARHTHRIQQLDRPVTFVRVHMRRFPVLMGIEVEGEAAFSQIRWHMLIPTITATAYALGWS